MSYFLKRLNGKTSKYAKSSAATAADGRCEHGAGWAIIWRQPSKLLRWGGMRRQMKQPAELINKSLSILKN